MKQKILFLALLFCSSTVFGQTTTLTYTNAGLGSNCNIFNPTVTLNNIQHLSRAGGVTYTGGNNNGLVLESIPSGQTAGGTAFVVNLCHCWC